MYTFNKDSNHYVHFAEKCIYICEVTYIFCRQAPETRRNIIFQINEIENTSFPGTSLSTRRESLHSICMIHGRNTDFNYESLTSYGHLFIAGK